MANGAEETPSLAFPRETFAKLTPGAYLQAHLKQSTPIRPNGRLLDEFRTPTINTGSLTNSSGSAVVRCGDTAIVCGVRAEILMASAIPNPPSEDLDEEDLVESLGLLVPNIELSTGCSPGHLPGSPPGTLAQSLSYRMLSLLHTSGIIDVANLKIQHTEASTDEDLPDEGPRTVTKAYWTLYIDILCIALDGNAFDAAWIAVMAALRDTILPKAWWDIDREMVLCSPRPAEASRLRLRDLPVATTFAVFSTASPLKQREDGESWVLGDPDGFEEEQARELVTVTLGAKGRGGLVILRLEKSGGEILGVAKIGECVRLAGGRHKQVSEILGTMGST